MSRELIETELFRSAYFDGAIHWWAHRNPSDCAGDIVGCHGLGQRSWETYLVAFCGQVSDTLDEFIELRRADDRIGDRGTLDQVFLGDLCPEVAAFEQPF